MPVVKQDNIGLYIESGGYVARPLDRTSLKVGDKVESRHFGGSVVHGVGKDPTLPRGDYHDYWLGCGMASVTDAKQREADFQWYSTHCANEVRGRKAAAARRRSPPPSPAASSAPAAPKVVRATNMAEVLNKMLDAAPSPAPASTPRRPRPR